MTQQEAIEEQQRLELIYGKEKLGWWFGTRCEKCCGVYPRFQTRNTNDKYHNAYYKCDVCGKQTDYYGMPSQAEEAWNGHKYLGEGVQISFL
jgi:hypothetical protein